MLNETLLTLNLYKLFAGLAGTIVNRQEILDLIEVAKKENQTDIIYRLSKILNDYPDEKRFEISEVTQFSTALNAARHAGIYKIALDDCGRLRKGFKFVNGSVVKVITTKVRALKTKLASLKSKYGLNGAAYFPEITTGLNGIRLADGHEIFSEKEFEEFSNNGEFIGGLNAAASDVSAIVNDLILERLKTGEELPPWKQSWASKTSVLAQNYETKVPYTGSNATILNILFGSIMPTPYYLTANQIKVKGGMIKKGTKGIPLVRYNFSYILKDLSSNPAAEMELLKKINGYEVKKFKGKSIFLNSSNYKGVLLSESTVKFLGLEQSEYFTKGSLMYFTVFNIADTTGIDYDIPEPKKLKTAERIEIAEAIIKGFKDCPKINFGQKEASYNSGTDRIGMPDIEDFDPIEEYYTTLFHEMIHATKIKTRLDRDAKYEGKEQKSMYAFEELIAELGASYLAGIAGILEVTSANATAYLKGWHEKLQIAAQDNSDFFVFATREATKAVDYILANFVMPGEKSNDEDDDLEMLELEAEAMIMKLKLQLQLKK